MKTTIRYYLMNPTENRTILVETPVSPERQSVVSTMLMDAEPKAEQAGFLSESGKADVALRMAGGEFCANATMSAAVLHAMCAGKTAGIVTVESSGAKEPVTVGIEAEPSGNWQGVVHMPRPAAIENVRFADGKTYPVVSFDGISHVILENEEPDRSASEALAKRRCAELHADAVGLMYWHRQACILTPLVYVPQADTLFWEQSCGSGTAAVGAYLAKEQGKTVCIPLRQPGGTLEITASPDGKLRLRGTVRCEYKRSAETEL